MKLIRDELESQIGKQVYLKADRGRKRYIQRKGILDAVYPSLFVVELDSKDPESIDVPSRRMTFTYSDILTNTVQLMIVDDSKN